MSKAELAVKKAKATLAQMQYSQPRSPLADDSFWLQAPHRPSDFKLLDPPRVLSDHPLSPSAVQPSPPRAQTLGTPASSP
mmetsp:Transcript_10398/g.16248  ORF Transcript_10398/g.16248 Transcript_10398/m.16248 type:complete len:80 (-) Transcript_10398:388-627(-)